MADKNINPKLAALKGLEAALHDHRHAMAAQADVGRSFDDAPLRRRFRFAWRPLVSRRIVIFAGGMIGVAALSLLLLWWRLASGPISLDIATPWLIAAIEENFGGRRHVEVGGTQIERDEHGRTALRIRDIVVRDADGTAVASAPGAEIGFSGMGLLSGRFRAQRLSLIGAKISVRIEADGKLTVFAGAEKRPFATALSKKEDDANSPPAQIPSDDSGSATGSAVDSIRAILAWIDGLGAAGLDGYDLDEIGIKNGNVSVDDQRSGKQWAFDKINLSLKRSSAGELSFNIGSDDPERPWTLLAGLNPGTDGRRSVVVEGRKVPLGDILSATRLLQGQFEIDVPVSVTLRAEIAKNGMPERATGRMIVEAGTIGKAGSALGHIPVERAEFSLDWEAARRVVSMPFQIVAGGNRFTLFAQAEAPREPDGVWLLGMTGGTIVLGPIGGTENDSLIINRILLRGHLDPAKKQIAIEYGDFASKDLGVAFSGGFDYSFPDPRLAVGIAARNMVPAALKQLWPAFINPKLRAWAASHFFGGGIERFEVALSSPLSNVLPSGPPVPEDGLSIDVATSGSLVRPIDGLPPIRDADLLISIKGHNVKVELGRGTIELPTGRKLTMSSGLFEVPDTHIPQPPTRTKFRIEGPVPAVAELLAMDSLREAAETPLDPAQARGTVVAQVNLALPIATEFPPGSVNYTITADLANFAADRFILGQRVEGSSLKVSANSQGYMLRGDVRIGGTPATVEYRKSRNDSEPEVRLQATFDEPARARLGFDLYGAVKGAIPVKVAGRIASGDNESRYAVDADLTQARIDNLLPGWLKAPGRPARATFTLVSKTRSTRFEDLLIEGSGALVKGAVEIDQNSNLQSANFPMFAISEGDKTTLKVERGNDSTLRVTMRGDVYDGRNFVKSQMAGPTLEQRTRQAVPDIDLDIKLGAVAGFNGEALRNLDLRMSRRAGEIRSLSFNARIGVDTPLTGDLRARPGGRQVMYFETADAGALFRYTDTYPRILGGKMWVAMDPPRANQAPQEGLLNIRDFSVRGEAALDRTVAGAMSGPNGSQTGVEFSRMSVEFTRAPGKLTLREGVVRGPVIGATIDGNVDYTRDEVRLRGTFVPLYGINNMFGQIPIVGLILGGGDKEGLLGITYEVVGPPSAPILRVNPISAVAPGLLRKVFEFPNTERGFPEPVIR